MAEYRDLLRCIDEEGLRDVPGDVLEIGAFCGEGTAALARHVGEKTVYTIDIFNIKADRTVSERGIKMREVYEHYLDGQDQRKAFEENVAGLANVVLIEGDSRKIKVPAKKLCFAFIDGGHSKVVVRSDFELVWGKLSPAGIVVMHDYGLDLPGVTEAVDEMIEKHLDEIEWVRKFPPMIYIRRKG